MSIDDALYTRLSGYSALTALVSTRIYPILLPQDCDLPAVAYQKISEISEHAMGIDSTVLQKRFQVSAFAEKYSMAKDVAAQIRAALSRYRATVGGVIIQDILFEGEIVLHEPDTDIYHIPLDFIVYHDA